MRLHLSYLFLLICVWGLQSPMLGPRVVGRGIILVGLVLISVIAHEVAHGLVTGPTSTLKRVLILMPLGGVTLSDENLMQQKDPVGRFRVAIVWPAHEPDPGAVCVERDQVGFPGDAHLC